MDLQKEILIVANKLGAAGGAALPVSVNISDDNGTSLTLTTFGLTKRDVFAAAALIGLIGRYAAPQSNHRLIAAEAFAMADAMLNVRMEPAT